MYETPEQILQLVENKDIMDNDCLWYLLNFQLYTILDTKIFDRFMMNKWQGWITINSSIVQYQTGYTLLMNEHGNMVNYHLLHNIWHNLTCLKERQNLIHRLTFMVWKQSMQSRLFLEGAFTFILTLVFQIFVSKYINSLHHIQKELGRIEMIERDAILDIDLSEIGDQIRTESLDETLFDLNIAIYISSI